MYVWYDSYICACTCTHIYPVLHTFKTKGCLYSFPKPFVLLLRRFFSILLGTVSQSAHTVLLPTGTSNNRHVAHPLRWQMFLHCHSTHWWMVCVPRYKFQDAALAPNYVCQFQILVLKFRRPFWQCCFSSCHTQATNERHLVCPNLFLQLE